MSADTADKILSSDWLVSLKLCSDWLDEPFKRRISKVETDKNTLKMRHIGQDGLIYLWLKLAKIIIITNNPNGSAAQAAHRGREMGR